MVALIFIQFYIQPERSPHIYLSLTHICSDQLPAAVFIFHSGYKLISCYFYLFRTPLLLLSVYWQVYLTKRDGRVKRPANRSEFVHSFEFFKLCDEKLSLNSLHSTAQKTYRSPRHFYDDLRGLVSCFRFYFNRPMMFSAYILNFSSTIFEKTTVDSRAF